MALLIFIYIYKEAVLYSVNSDMVLPADLTHLVFQQNFPLDSYLLPRAPGIFPDLLIYIPLLLVSGSWRFVIFCMAALHLSGLTFGAGLIIRQMVGARVRHAAIIFLLLAVPVILWEIAKGQFYRHLHLIEQVISHSGEFVISLFALVLALSAVHEARPDKLFGLFAVSVCCFLSDKLSLFEWHLPLIIAIAPLLWRDERPNAIRTLAAVIAGLVAAYFVDRVLFSHLLQRSGEIAIRLSTIGQHSGLWLQDVSWGMLLGGILPAAIVFGASGIIPMFHGRTQRLTRYFADKNRPNFLLCWRFGLAAAFMPLVLVITLLYERPPHQSAFVDFVEINWQRYCDTLFWWPVIVMAAVAAAALEGIGLRRLIVPAGLALLMLLIVRLPHHLPLLATWRSPMADCLKDNYASLGPVSGLAGYWNARSVAIGLDWSIEIDQIYPDGHRFLWGNDALSYQKRPGKPRYGFVIIRGLEVAEIQKNYGGPDRILSCPGSDIWIYQDAALIDRTLELDSRP
jgi:hypothetical protein